MINLIFIRHGEALASGDPQLGDDGRRLTALGRAQARRTGQAIGKKLSADVPRRLISSPLVRAVQTAELIAQGMAYEDVIDAICELRPESSPGELLGRLAEIYGANDPAQTLICVAHEPLLSTTAKLLNGSPVPAIHTASAFHFEVTGFEPGAAQLRWIWQPRVEQFVEVE